MIQMDFKQYQDAAEATAIYPEELGPIYTVLGLVGEAGEVAEIVKKFMRDDNDVESVRDRIGAELGDVLWYVAETARQWGLDLGEIAAENVLKLASRKERGALRGSGDNR